MSKLVTDDQLLEAINRSQTSLDNPGFCLACGEEAYGVEPDAQEYVCEYCGKSAVFGAEEILLGGLN